MKKNININFFGTLYAIDEDAYKLLGSYLDNMRSYFARRDGGDEIADDIEHRVAEHLWTLKEQGLTAIDITAVKSVIESIGNPAQVDGGTESNDADRDWHYLSTARFRCSGGMLEYRLRIGLHDVKDGNAVCGRMWLAHIGLRKQ